MACVGEGAGHLQQESEGPKLLFDLFPLAPHPQAASGSQIFLQPQAQSPHLCSWSPSWPRLLWAAKAKRIP